MLHSEFKDIFDREFAAPLSAIGFAFMGRSRTLQYLNNKSDLRIIRLGGRLLRQGEMRSVVCFRHTFLRPINSDDPANAKNVEDFPRKQIFQDFSGFFSPKIGYQPENTGRWRKDSFDYQNATNDDVIHRLRKFRYSVEKRIVPWADSLSPEDEMKQIKRFGEQAWCEQRWIEDYETFLSLQ